MERFKPELLPGSGRHLIEASAGTGKTHALMSLITRALAVDGHQPEHCLLMTFTRASTRELRARVRERLVEEIDLLTRGRSELTAAYPNFSGDQGIERLGRALRRLDTIEIQTIHGFAIRLVNDLGPSVGIPSFPVETDIGGIRQEVAIDCYRRLVTEHGAHHIGSLTGGLTAFVGHAELAWRPIDDIKPPSTQCPDLAAIGPEFVQRRNELLSDIESLFALNGMNRKSLETHTRNIENADTRQDIPNESAKYFLEREEKFDGTVFDQWVELIRPSDDEVKFRAYCLHQLREQLRLRLNELGISDNDQVIRDAAEVARRVDNERPTHTLILVDEFQDTDRHQWAMLDHLYPDEPQRLMVMVGDPKQAIYRFRGADTAFYHQVRNNLPDQRLWYLDTVYRSSQTMVDGLNALYDDNHPVGDVLRYKPLETGRPEDIRPLTMNDTETAGFQWIESLSPQTVVQLTASLLAGGQQCSCRIGTRPITEKDICILVQSRATAQKIKRLGGQFGLAFHYQNKASIFSRRIAREVVLVLEAIANPDDLSRVTSAASTTLMGFDLSAPGQLSERARFIELQTQLFNARDLWKSDGPAAAIASLFEACSTARRISHTLQGLEDWSVLNQCLEIFGEDAKGLSPLEAVIWWTQQAAPSKEADDRTSQRPPTDSGVVTINTIHGSKGLEYGVVILADEITGKAPPKNTWGLDYCDQNGSRIDLTKDALEPALQDQEEDLNRLLYVALTRAKHGVFLGVPEADSALSRLLNDRDILGLGRGHHVIEAPGIDDPLEQFTVPTAQGPVLKQPNIPSWFFRSFSGLIRHEGSHELMPGAGDEDDSNVETNLNEKWHMVPGGTGTGNFIHAILEWHADGVRDALAVGRFIKTNWPTHLDPTHEPVVVDWVHQILSTELTPSSVLGALSPKKKRPEPKFELPLRPRLRLSELFNACGAFSWWRPLTPPIDQTITGHLIGFIDLVYEADGRFHIVDYKTNHLGPRDQAYTDEYIEYAMGNAFYPIQAAIYALALHRWLKSRLKDYDPDRHLGEVIYLFCRGIHAPNRGIWRRPIEANGVLALEECCLCTQ